MSIQKILEPMPAISSQLAPIELVEAGGPADAERGEEENQHPALHQDKEKGGKEILDMADFPVDNTLKAFVWVHTGWRRHRNGSCAVCPICTTVVQCAGNTTNLWRTTPGGITKTSTINSRSRRKLSGRRQAEEPLRSSSLARKDYRKTEDLDDADLLFAEMLETCDTSASEEAPALAPQSCEAILAESKRSGGYQLTQYMEGETLHPSVSATAVLQWWFDHSQIYPFLYKVACVYLAVPASSGSSERVFSTAGNIVTKKRNRLGSESINNLVFLHGCHGVGWKMGEGLQVQ